MQKDGKRTRNALREWIFAVLLPMLCALLVLPLVCASLLVIEIIDRCRRSCPVHRTPFQHETIAVTPTEAEANEELKRGQRLLTAFWPIDYPRWKQKQFPYASTDHFTKPGTHRRRFCPACREGELSHTFADFENDSNNMESKKRELEARIRELERLQADNE